MVFLIVPAFKWAQNMAHYRPSLDERDWSYLLLSVAAYLGIFLGLIFLAPYLSKNILSVLGQ